MSHELRTPLNAVIGYSEILLEDTDADADPTACADLARIHSAGQKLLSLVNAILDLSKIEAGKMEVFRETRRPRKIRRRSRGALERRATRIAAIVVSARLVGASDACLRLTSPSLIGWSARWSTMRCASPITATSRSSSMRRRAHGADGEGWLSIAVRDTGCGIAAESIPKLFEIFVNREDATASNYGSAGLGLPLCDRLCRLLGGSLTVESEPGKGSAFTIRLPQGDVAGAEAADGILARSRVRGPGRCPKSSSSKTTN